jgi:hypothetical protein
MIMFIWAVIFLFLTWEPFFIWPEVWTYFSALFYKICHTFASVWSKMASVMIVGRKEKDMTLPPTFHYLILLRQRAWKDTKVEVFHFQMLFKILPFHILAHFFGFL